MDSRYKYILSKFNFPNEAFVNQKIPKKEFYNNANFKWRDKEIFTKDIESIELLYLLNEDTINILSYRDDTLTYNEVAILGIELRDDKRIDDLALLVQGAIPYPLIIIFKIEDRYLINIALKRDSKIDDEKIVIDLLFSTDWISKSSSSIQQESFLNSLNINQISHANFYEFYKDISNRIRSYELVKYISQFNIYNEKELQRLNKLTNEIKRLKNIVSIYKKQQNKSTQFNEKVRLNIEIDKHLKLIDKKTKELMTWKK